MENGHLAGGGSSKLIGKNYDWFGKNKEDRIVEGEKFAQFLFKLSPLRRKVFMRCLYD